MACRQGLRRLAVASTASRWALPAKHRVVPALLTRCQHHPAAPGIPHTANLHTSTPRLNEHVIQIQDQDDFDKRVLENPMPVVIDFHATWCGPCKLLGPRLESFISQQAGKVVMAKVDIDENTDIAMNYGVEAVPTVISMKDGKIQDKFVGLKDDVQIESFVSKLTQD